MLPDSKSGRTLSKGTRSMRLAPPQPILRQAKRRHIITPSGRQYDLPSPLPPPLSSAHPSLWEELGMGSLKALSIKLKISNCQTKNQNNLFWFAIRAKLQCNKHQIRDQNKLFCFSVCYLLFFSLVVAAVRFGTVIHLSLTYCNPHLP